MPPPHPVFLQHFTPPQQPTGPATSVPLHRGIAECQQGPTTLPTLGQPLLQSVPVADQGLVDQLHPALRPTLVAFSGHQQTGLNQPVQDNGSVARVIGHLKQLGATANRSGVLGGHQAQQQQLRLGLLGGGQVFQDLVGVTGQRALDAPKAAVGVPGQPLPAPVPGLPHPVRAELQQRQGGGRLRDGVHHRRDQIGGLEGVFDLRQGPHQRSDQAVSIGRCHHLDLPAVQTSQGGKGGQSTEEVLAQREHHPDRAYGISACRGNGGGKSRLLFGIGTQGQQLFTLVDDDDQALFSRPTPARQGRTQRGGVSLKHLAGMDTPGLGLEDLAQPSGERSQRLGSRSNQDVCVVAQVRQDASLEQRGLAAAAGARDGD